MEIHPPSINSIAHNPQVTGPLTQSILLVVVIVLFGWFLVLPKHSSNGMQHDTLKAAEQKRAAIQNDKRELENLISELNNSEQEVKIVDEALPLVGRVSRIDVLLDNLAKSSGLEVAQIDAENPETMIAAGNKAVLEDPFSVERSLQTTDVNMLVTGTIDQFRNFLQQLETSGRLLDVSTLDITSSQGVNRYSLTIKTYAYEVGTEVQE